MTAKDFSEDFQTPPEYCGYMVSLLPIGINSVLEPTPGLGNLVKALKGAGYQVTQPDDFFLIPPGSRFDAVVMNPPFSLKYTITENAPLHLIKEGNKMGYSILSQCMDMADTVIALMPWFTISDSDVRMRRLKRWGLRSITALPRKAFNYIRVQTIVLHLEKGYAGKTDFIVYDLLQSPKQITLL